jgi:hypothetical protein
MRETKLVVDVRHTFNFGKIKDGDNLPIDFIKDYIQEGGEAGNLEEAMPKQVYEEDRSITGIEEVRKYDE